MTDAYNPSYLRRWDGEDCSSKPDVAKPIYLNGEKKKKLGREGGERRREEEEKNLERETKNLEWDKVSYVVI